MFGVSGWDLIVLGVVAMVLVGPERLPKLAADAATWVRRLRDLAERARTDLTDTIGSEAAGFVDDLRGLADLHPKKIIANALAEPSTPAKPEPTVKPLEPGAVPGFDPDAT